MKIEESFSHSITEFETVILDSMSMHPDVRRQSVPTDKVTSTPTTVVDQNLLDYMSVYQDFKLALPRRRGLLPKLLGTRNGKSLYVCPEDRDMVRDVENRIDHRLSTMGLASGLGLSAALHLARTQDNPLVYVTDSETHRATTSRTVRGVMPQVIIDDLRFSSDHDEFTTPRYWEKHIPRVRKSVSENRDSKPSVPEIHYRNVTDHMFRMLRRIRPSLYILTRMMMAIRRQVPLSHVDSNDELLYSIKSEYPQIEVYRKLPTGDYTLKFDPQPKTGFDDYIIEDAKIYLDYLKQRKY